MATDLTPEEKLIIHLEYLNECDITAIEGFHDAINSRRDDLNKKIERIKELKELLK